MPSQPDGIADILARYAAIVDDFQALLDTVRQPLPVCLWHNPLKSCAAELQQQLAAAGVALTPVSWHPGAFRVSQWDTPGKTLPFAAGWYYLQEEIAMTAVQALAPQAGECILDLCAAPGGKLAQIATRLSSGVVVANELHATRLPSLTATVNRLGLTNAVTLQGDGRSLAPLPQSFDRVLVDAPCSGEGNLRRRATPQPWRPSHGARMAAAQKRLLSRALDLVKPGGVVVYSTCTFAPEENEAVLDAVVGDRAAVVPFTIPGLHHQPGITRWQDQAYRQDIAHAHRYFPHFNNTGGFFVAKLRRTSAAQSIPAMPPAEPLPPVTCEVGSPLERLRQRFAIAPKQFARYECWATGKRRLWLLERHIPLLSSSTPQTLGLSLATHTNLGLKPSTAFLQRFGGLAQQNVVQLPNEAAAIAFMQGQPQAMTATVDTGYVHVRYGKYELGCGYYRPGWLESQIPKTLRWL